MGTLIQVKLRANDGVICETKSISDLEQLISNPTVMKISENQIRKIHSLMNNFKSKIIHPIIDHPLAISNEIIKTINLKSEYINQVEIFAKNLLDICDPDDGRESKRVRTESERKEIESKEVEEERGVETDTNNTAEEERSDTNKTEGERKVEIRRKVEIEKAKNAFKRITQEKKEIKLERKTKEERANKKAKAQLEKIEIRRKAEIERAKEKTEVELEKIAKREQKKFSDLNFVKEALQEMETNKALQKMETKKALQEMETKKAEALEALVKVPKAKQPEEFKPEELAKDDKIVAYRDCSLIKWGKDHKKALIITGIAIAIIAVALVMYHFNSSMHHLLNKNVSIFSHKMSIGKILGIALPIIGLSATGLYFLLRKKEEIPPLFNESTPSPSDDPAYGNL